MIQWFETRVWQIGTTLSAGAAVGLAGGLLITTLQKNDLDRRLKQATAAYQTQAGNYQTCKNSKSTLAAAIIRSNEDVQRIANESAARIATARGQVEAARRENAIIQSRLDRALVTPIRGETPCARVDDVDQRVLEMLR